MDNEIEQLRILFKESLHQITVIDDSTMLDANKQWRNNQDLADGYVALLQPRNETELTENFKLCVEHNVGVVPRAGGTALTNGSTIGPNGRGKPCVVVQPNFKKTLNIKHLSDDVLVTVSPDVTAKDIEEHSLLAGKYKVPVDLGIGSKEGIATIAGYLANNAAGTGAAFHGRAIDMVEHVRAIKADGSEWEMNGDDKEALSELVGMGGTTGFITEATIKLMPVPKHTAVMALRLQDIDEMYNLLDACKLTCWTEMQLFERMNNDLFQEVVKQLEREDHRFTNHLNKVSDAKGDIVFIQLGSNKKTVTELRQTLKGLTAILKRDAQPIIPLNDTPHDKSQEFLLSYRVVNASTACEKYRDNHGGKVVAFDISVPSGDTAPFPSKELITKLETEFPGIKIFSFGHAAGVEKITPTTPRGGTALHFNPILPEELIEREQELRDLVFAEISARGGKIVSEHAVGTKLVKDSEKYTPSENAEHLTIIKKHDPENILNPNAFVHSY